MPPARDDRSLDGELPDDSAPAPAPGSGFGLFGETLLTGLLVAVASLPVVTLLPAVAAGCRHLRRYVRGEADALRLLVADLLAALRALGLLGVAFTALLVLLAVNTVFLWQGVVPGGRPLAVVMVALAAGTAVVALRSAALWRLGTSPGQLVQRAARRSFTDPTGSLLVVVAIGLCGVLVWMLAPLLVVAPGLLTLALVAVEHRHGGEHGAPAP